MHVSWVNIKLRYIYSILGVMGLFLLRGSPQLGMQCHDSPMKSRKQVWK